MRNVSSLVAMCASAFAIVLPVASDAAGLDGVSFTTNDWFDASFASLAIDTVIATNTTTGITRGMGSWTAAPTNGTAKIVADGAGPATYLEVKAPGEELTFTPSVLVSPTGYETVSAEVRATVMEELPELSGVQTAFMVYDDETSVKPCGYTATGWTNLVYSGAMSDLTNGWFEIYADFASISGIRCVRYSVKPSGGSLSVLKDSAGETWFQTAGSATTVNSVSLSGTGDCRAINGDSLAEVMVAEVGGVQYSTVNAAIAAASAGDTVSLVRALDGADVAVSKGITLALGSYNLAAASFSVASGVTLTVTGTGAISAPAITGGGSVAFSNAATLNLTGGSSALATITAADNLTIVGYGSVAVSGAVNVAGVLNFALNSFVDVKESIGDTYTINLSAATVSAASLVGVGNIATSGGVEADAASFHGSVGGAGGYTARGLTTFYGRNSFTGDLSLGAGAKVKIVSSLDGLSPFFRLDASDEDSVVTDDSGHVTNWVSQVNGHTFTNETSQMTLSTDYFGGRKAVVTQMDTLYTSYTKSNTRHAQSFIGAVRYVEAGTGTRVLFGFNSNNCHIGKRGSDYAYWSKMKGSKQEYYSGFWQNGVYGKTYFNASEDVTFTVIGFNRFSNAGEPEPERFGGNGASLAIGELIAFNNSDPTHEQIKQAETYLANKWGVSGRSLSGTAGVGLAAGSLLDLGGTAQAIASLSGSGVVSNGTLTVTDPISVAVGSMLVIPYGSTYTCASGTGANIDTTAGTVTLLHKAADVGGVVYETVQDAFDAYESGTLTIYENATDIDLGTTEKSVVIVLADGVSAPTFSTTLPWQTTYSEGTLTHARIASTFVYIGPSAYSPVASNFEIGGVVASDAPGDSDTVQFDTDVTITTSSTGYRYEAVVVNAAVTLNGGSNSYYLHANSISGTGKLALGNYAKIATQSGTGTISCELEVNAAGSSNAAQLYIADGGREMTLTGVLSGSGYLKCTRKANTSSSYSGNTFHCSDTTGFTGTIESVKPGSNDVGRNQITFWPTCDLSGATVIVGQYSGGRGRIIDGQSNSTVYRFGSFSGYVSPSASNIGNSHPTIEIGALNRNDTVTGNWMPHGDRNPYIRKVGTGTLTTTAANAYGYILNGGTLKVLATDTAPVVTEIKGMKPVCTTETIGADEYKVYTLEKRGATFIFF